MLELVRHTNRLRQAVVRGLRESGEFDPCSLDARDPRVVDAASDTFGWLREHYFRAHVDGVHRIPDRPVLFVANHNGGLAGPDLPVTLSTLWQALASRPLYGMAHDFAMKHLTWLGRAAQLGGALRASRDTAHHALMSGGCVLVFPGGEMEAFRRRDRASEIVFGDRVGFVQVARRAGVPIVPIVAEGAHRSAWVLHEGRQIARALRLRDWTRNERFPIALALPWGLTLGPWLPYAPLPFRVRLTILPPIEVGHANDRTVQEHVVRTMQHELRRLANA